MSILKQLILIAVICLVFAIVEIYRPAERIQPFKERLRNIAFMFIYILIGGGITVYIFSNIPVYGPIVSSYDMVSVTILTVLALFLWDLLFYWYHRAEHTLPWLWRVHQFHHSDAHINTSSTFRHSWLEYPLQEAFISLPIGYLLQLDAAGWFVVSTMTLTWLFFIHTNWRLHLGPATSIIGGPQLHRIHHSSLDEHRDKNFAVFFPVIDKIFGTYYAPGKDEFPPTGLKDMATHVSWKSALIGPFSDWKNEKR